MTRALAVVACMAWLPGCVTTAEYRKLERDVRSLQRRDAGSPGGREQLADLSARVDGLAQEIERLQGRLEVAEHQTSQALEESRLARREASGGVAPLGARPGVAPGGSAPGAAPPAGVRPGDTEPPPLGTPQPESGGAQSGASTEEVQAYRGAYALWRSNDSDGCIDQFRKFLQAYPASVYADDAAYWMADCHFKKGDYKTAVLRFDDVVARYPKGNKAADALYRQGEALLKMGPGYTKAAGKAFERVVREYPDSSRAAEAKKQLQVLQTG